MASADPKSVMFLGSELAIETARESAGGLAVTVIDFAHREDRGLVVAPSGTDEIGIRIWAKGARPGGAHDGIHLELTQDDDDDSYVFAVGGDLNLLADGDIVFAPIGSLVVGDDIPLYFGTGKDWSLKYDETTTDSLILSEGAVGTLAVNGAAVVGFAAASDTPGNDVYVATQAAGTNAGGNPRGGNLHVIPGTGTGTGKPGQIVLGVEPTTPATTLDGHVVIGNAVAAHKNLILQSFDIAPGGEILLEFQIGSGTARASVHRDGGNIGFTGDWYKSHDGRFSLSYVGASYVNLQLHDTARISWGPNATVGADDTGLARAAVDVLRITDGSTGIGSLLFGRYVLPKTGGVGSPYSVLGTDSNAVFTNEGATAEVYLNLPTAVANLTYTVMVQDADGVRVVASGGDTIRLGTGVSAAAGYVRSSEIGAALKLVAINATEWLVESIVGTWTIDS